MWGRYTSGILDIFGQRFGHPPTVLAAGLQAASAPNHLTLAFSENVGGSLVVSDLELMNLTTGRPVRLMRNAMTWDQQTFTASFRIAGRRCQVLPDGYYRATLPAGCVTDPAGNPLAQDYTFDFHILAGDANGDAIVDVSDLMILAGNWKGSGKTFSQGDFDYSGVVDEADLALLAKNWQKTPDGTIASSAPLPTIAGITSPPPATPARRSVREVFRPVDVVE